MESFKNVRIYDDDIQLFIDGLNYLIGMEQERIGANRKSLVKNYDMPEEQYHARLAIQASNLRIAKAERLKAIIGG